MSIMNSSERYIFSSASPPNLPFAYYNKRSTITSREIQTAVRLLCFPVNSESTQFPKETAVVIKYTSFEIILKDFGREKALFQGQNSESKRKRN
ncbi:hypothetical protein TNIN_145531 [Trichonephila inaurata madagascariensis]|uniref:Uncharacterized protein n=1 Tax=Trichonephila inaurata madagascariensis TaxID=2747483 RepID=A0A8X6WPW4_9ARAC|nr:hypothetical protein TNIN_145531 [Trichonephila inaurata madagascariensis]